MRLEATDKGSEFYFVYDVENECLIEKCIEWADEETGEICFQPADFTAESIIYHYDENSNLLPKVVEKANIKLIDMRKKENLELCEKVGMSDYFMTGNWMKKYASG